MAGRRLVGRCAPLFALAVAFDALGFALIAVGVFAELQLDGRSFGEFLIYGGGILLFFSLLWWLAWYSFNLEVSMDDLLRENPVTPSRGSSSLGRRLATKLSHSFSRRTRRKLDVLPIGHSPTPHPHNGPAPLTPFVFVNNGLPGPLQTPTPNPGHKQLELRTVSALCEQLEVAGVHGMVDRLI